MDDLEIAAPPRLQLEAGDLLFEEGEQSSAAYFIEQGRAEVFKQVDGSEVVIATVGPGELIGEMALIGAGPRTASVRVLEPTTVTPVTEESLLSRLQDADPLLQLVLRMALDRLRGLLEQMGHADAPAGGGAPARTAMSEQLREQTIDRARIEQELREALERDLLVLHYQPIVDLDTMQPVGCEALVRWDRPGHGMVSPGVFVAIAEQTDLILSLGRWAFHRACRDLAQTPALDALYVGINVATRQFQKDDVGQLAREAIDASGIAPERVRVEITESAMMRAAGRTAEALRAVRRLGGSTAIDDFGTGYSSLSYLQNLDVDAIKIDRAFVLGMRARHTGARLIRGIAALGKTLDLKVVVEGVEDHAEALRLRDLGCDYGQGFHFSRPLPLEQFVDWLARRPATPPNPD